MGKKKKVRGNLRAKRRETFSRSHALAIAQEANARDMKDIHVYKKPGLLRTKFIVTYLDRSHGEKLRGQMGNAGRRTGGLLSKLRKR